jgi:hypothetical protein
MFSFTSPAHQEVLVSPLPVLLYPLFTFASPYPHMVPVIFKQKTTIIIAHYGLQNATNMTYIF